MSRHSFSPNCFVRWRILDVLALAPMTSVAPGCATVAGFEDFSPKGTGGQSNTPGGAFTGGQPAACGEANQRCCASPSSCNNGACCVNGTCVAPGTSCGAAGASTCQTGHCTGCGQVNQNCCGGSSCEFGLECANGQCRACGTNLLSCCENGNFPACIAGSVCVGSSGSLQNICVTNCGAQSRACCIGGTYTGSGCEVGTNLTCTGGVCRQ